jgi:hypothetical protein
MDAIPIWILFTATVLVVAIAIELGYKVGLLQSKNSKKDKDEITTVNSGAILGLLGFILVFTFGIVYSRYDSKKELLREEANLIRTAWLRADFLPSQDHSKAQMLLRKYVDLRVGVVSLDDPLKIQAVLNESNQIQNQLWEMAVFNARKDMNSDVAALYIESLNEMINQHALRVAVGIHTRIPTAIWLLLYLLVILGMFGVGYQASITGSSRRSWLTPVMILTFSLMILLIVALDRPNNKVIPVSQQPLVDLRTWMGESTKTP